MRPGKTSAPKITGQTVGKPWANRGQTAGSTKARQLSKPETAKYQDFPRHTLALRPVAR